MDPLTHGMIGLALSTFSGHSVTLSNPIAIGCAVGAMIPDMDSVIRIFSNDAVYLKHHRGFSHSVPALAGFALVISTVLTLAMPTASFWQIALWTFIGGLSHTLFDILNSYGAMLLRKKRKLNLLTLYDPIVALLGIALIAQRQVDWWLNVIAGLVFAGYMLMRYWHRNQAARELETHFSGDHRVLSVSVLPSLMAFYKWDFIVETEEFTFVGKFNQWTKAVVVVERLDAQCPQMRERFDQTRLGAYFNDFSPHLHVVHTQKGDAVVLRVIDLRYYVRDRFLHQATLVLSADDYKVRKSTLHPYGQRRSVSFREVV